MKVYVFTAEGASQCEFFDIDVKVFDSLEKAEKCLKEWRDDAIQYIEQDGMEIDFDEPDYFVACRADFCNYHYVFQVTELEIA